MWVRTKDGKEKPAPGTALALPRLLLVEDTECGRSKDYTSDFLVLEGILRKTKLNWKKKYRSLSRKSLHTTVGTHCPGKGRIPLLKRIFFPETELLP